MTFSKYSKRFSNNGILQYIKEEQSFLCEPFLKSEFTLMLGCSYLGLDISLKTMEILNVSGLCPQHIWISKELMLPKNVCIGSVKIETSEVFMSGTAKYLFDKIPIYYDKKTNWCCISNNLDEIPDQNIEIIKNCILSLTKGRFVALWLNPDLH